MQNKFDKIYELNNEMRKNINSVNYFSEIFNYLYENASKNKSILVNLSNYKFIHPAFAVLIPAIYYVAIETNNKVLIRYSKDNLKCNDFLSKSGILKHFLGKDTKARTRNKQLDFKIVKDDEDGTELATDIIEKSPVKLSEDLKNELISKIYELFANAFTHSSSKNVFCCGCCDSQGSFVFSVYDTGVGIIDNVNKYVGKTFQPKEALEWAWRTGNSTLNGIVDYPRGKGLNILEEFIKLNNGEIFMISDKSHCKINKKTRYFENNEINLKGTLISISIRKDNEHIYKFKGGNTNEN